MKNLTSQIVMSSWRDTRHGTFAFTEQGIAMLSSVLKSKLAIQINISIMRAFVMMRQWSLTYHELAERLEELERKHGQRFDGIEQVLNYFIQKDKQSTQQNQKKNKWDIKIELKTLEAPPPLQHPVFTPTAFSIRGLIFFFYFYCKLHLETVSVGYHQL